MLCAKFGWKWYSGSGEEDFKILSMYFDYHFPLEKGDSFNLNEIEFPSPKHALCLVWVKLAEWFWREDFKILSISL